VAVSIRVAIRGFADKQLVFDHRIELPETEIERLLPHLAEAHGDALAQHSLHVIEIEFLDEPNPNERFFRFGTDPNGMVMPMEINLEKKN
jgi:hypothetical protein